MMYFKSRTGYCCLVLLIISLSGLCFGQSKELLSFPEVRINLPDKQFRSLLRVRGQKMTLRDAELTIDGEQTRIDDLHLRGKTTLSFRRKSFSVDLEEPVAIKMGDHTAMLSKFDLLNLAMDRNFWHNRWSFLVMANLGIFPPVNTYCTLWINEEPQGIYLLTEKPQHAMVALESPYMIRRGTDSGIEKEYVKTKSKEDIKKYRRQYRSLYNTGNLKAMELYDHLGNAINTKSYFLWVGFNYFVMNGDYSDELFLYINPSSGLYEVMAWDYDDLFKESPHEGKPARNEAYRDRYLFSLEDRLDKVIAADELVYSKYGDALLGMLAVTDSTLLARTSQQVLQELRVLNSEPEIARASLYLDSQPFIIEDAAYDMERSMQFLYYRRAVLLNSLKQTIDGKKGK
jgi:spore coat protein H